jgi:hypothetical protein
MDLSELRDVMLDSRKRWTTFRARGTEWRDAELVNEAFRHRFRPGPNAVFVEGIADTPREQVESWSLWIELPDKIRAEFGVGGERVTVVFRGATWWSISSYSEPMTNGGAPNTRHGMGPGYPLTEPRQLVSALDLEPRGHVTFAGRPAVWVSAVPLVQSRSDATERFTFDDAVFDLGAGADRYALVVDRERGLILRSEALFQGKPFAICEVHDIDFDVSIADDTFTLEPPPGTTFVDARERFGRSYDAFELDAPDDDL